jgi:hypothetical protein
MARTPILCLVDVVAGRAKATSSAVRLPRSQSNEGHHDFQTSAGGTIKAAIAAGRR